MKKEDFSKRIAYLEFANAQLSSEIKYIDALLRSIGFPEGLQTVKEAAKEIQTNDLPEPEDHGED